MKKARKMTQLLTGVVAFSMILSGLIISTSVSGDGEPLTVVTPTVRIYGEENAVYPTHSYQGTGDFIYPEEYDPFDPGIIQKDSITFNPAWLNGEIYNLGFDVDEKVFLRTFYEPGYYHGVDDNMSYWYAYPPDCMEPVPNPNLYPNEQFHSVVTETTYFTTTARHLGGDPTLVYPGDTNLWLPYQSTDGFDGDPGMDKAGSVKLVYANNSGGLTHGAIAVEKTFKLYDDPAETNSARFFDHELTFLDYENQDGEDADKLFINVKYIGNMNDQAAGGPGGQGETHELVETDWDSTWFFTRENTKCQPDCFEDYDGQPWFDAVKDEYGARWYLTVDYASESFTTFKLGRYLFAGETFYVDGMRYDMPAIYTQMDGDTYGFKYITFQSPIPKCDTIWYDPPDEPLSKNVDDWTHVHSQYLANLPEGDDVWLLPPFNMQYRMIDDIGIQNMGLGCDSEYDRGILLEQPKGPLYFYYVYETIEDRFNSSLAERLYTDEGGEDWHWWNVHTLPQNYTEFYLPDAETNNDAYDPYWEDVSFNADGNEYLITSSFIAPNSNAFMGCRDCCGTSCDTLSKPFDAHELYDRANTIAHIGDTTEYYGSPRVAFEYNGEKYRDLYVNEVGPDMNTVTNVSVSIYGEKNAYYPTHSWSGSENFIYEDETDPFDPGVIEKDSMTFNPAWIYGEPMGISWDVDEKVFLRAFYEPHYTHIPDDKMTNWYGPFNQLYDVETFDAVTLETTYFMINSLTVSEDPGMPTMVPVLSYVYLPYVSDDPNVPGMDTAGLVKIANIFDEPREYGIDEKEGSNPNDCLTDGEIWVEKEYTLSLNGQKTATFFDHEFSYIDFENSAGDDDNDKLYVKIKYKGNMMPGADAMEEGKAKYYEIPTEDENQRFFFDRENNKFPNDNEYGAKWYIKIKHASENNLELVLGRVLTAGDTFYVDGVRYDMPAIYTYNEGGSIGFKYITLQTPIPKCQTIWYDSPLFYNVDDWSHVHSQYLANLPMMHDAWVLPPFNQDTYRMIDDIGLQKLSCEPGSKIDETNDCMITVPEGGLLIQENIDKLRLQYVKESYEERYDTNLVERLRTDCGGDEFWEWYNIYTKPYNYTEFIVVDDQEKPGYHYDTVFQDPPYSEVDGNEYLITSSWIAQNSQNMDYSEECKPCCTHEIINNMDSYTDSHLYDGHLRVAFEFDGKDSTGIYINDMNRMFVWEKYPFPEPNDPTPPMACADITEGCYVVDFDVSCSYDTDTIGDNPAIDFFRWDVNNDDVWDTPGTDHWVSTSGGYTWSFDYSGYTFPVNAKLQVKDNDGQTSTVAYYSVDLSGCEDVVLAVGEDTDCTDFMVPVDVMGISAPGLNSYECTISYDEALFTVDTVTDELDVYGTLLWNTDTTDQLKISWVKNGAAGPFTGDFTLCNIAFSANGTVADGDYPLAVLNSKLVDETITQIDHLSTNGELTVVDCLPCLVGNFHQDVVGTQVINILDLRDLLAVSQDKAGYDANGLNPDVDCSGGSDPVDIIDVSLFAEWYFDGADQSDLGGMYPTGCDPCTPCCS